MLTDSQAIVGDAPLERFPRFVAIIDQGHIIAWMDRRYRDLLPGSAAIENLEELLKEALEIPDFLESREGNTGDPNLDWYGSQWHAAETRLASFAERIRQRSQFIGDVAAARILREAVPHHETVDTVRNPQWVLRPLRSWIDGVISNIQFELHAIERKQMLVVTVTATLISAFAALMAVVTVLVDVLKQ